MKRKSMLFALLMTGVMVLSACSGGTKDTKSDEKASDDSKKTLKLQQKEICIHGLIPKTVRS